MTFAWSAQKDAWQGKLNLSRLGTATGNAPATKTVTSLDQTLQVIEVLGQTGWIVESGSPLQPTVQLESRSEKDHNAYVLPWKSCAATITKLGGKQPIFVTSQLSGCALFIGGDASSPTVIHANANPDFLDSGRPDGLAQEILFEKEVRIPRWDSYYGAIAQKLATTNDLPKTNTRTLLPSEYAASGTAAVFGVKDGGSWKLYLNAGNKTKRFWPAA